MKYLKKRKELSLLTITTKNTLLSTPGEILKDEFLTPLKISQYKLAKAIKKPESAISDIVNNKRAITAEMSYLLGEAFGISHEYFLNLQTTYDIKTIEDAEMPSVKRLIEAA